MSANTLPYKAEYAKSGRASCKGCKELIGQGTLRLAIMVQSPFFDGMQPNWFHHGCFFKRARPKSADEFSHFQDLRWNDQEDLKKKIEAAIHGPPLPEPSKKGKGKGKSSKRPATDSVDGSPPDLADYTVEYSKSGRAKCKVCEEQIVKDVIRISKKDYESDIAKRYGPSERWHHVDCFVRAREELGFFAPGSILPGFHAMAPEDQKILKSKLPKIEETNGSSPAKKPKTEIPEDSKLVDLMKKQNDTMYKLRDKLESLAKKELIHLLEHNDLPVPEGVDRILDRLADVMAFGIPEKCSKCAGGTLVFRSGVGYQCTGSTEWAKCTEIYEKPKKSAFKIPKDLKEDYSFLKKFKPKTEDRAFKKAELPKETAASSSSTSSSKKSLPLVGLEFILHKPEKDSKELQKTIEGLGGKVVKKFHEKLSAVVSISAEATKAKLAKVISSASDADIPVISESFFDAIQSTSTREDILNAFKDKKLSLWGADISTKLAYDTVDGGKSVYRSKSEAAGKSLFKSELGVQKLTLKGGLVVDPDSKLEKKAHVYRKKGDPKEVYSTVLSITDVQTQKNSYYKLQVLEADKGNRYWLFRSWGRIGTTIGGNKTEEYSTAHEATDAFENLFEEKSGNIWALRDNFEKIPGKMMMLDVSHGTEVDKKAQSDIPSKLPKPIQNLISLIFDVEAMKKTMLEFELDLNKMPLGKLSQKQIMKAFSLLGELQNKRNEGGSDSQITAITNQFYTLVPHDFGIENPPLLNNDEIINQKIEMLNNLLDIEIAYKLLESADSTEVSPIDDHYEKLKAKMSVLDEKSQEFADIKKYVENSHAATHRQYELIIENVFKIEREGEASRFKKFKKLPNHMLLWHGSRTTNFAGILSQGLRIAPPEAPVTGYMFGKGIYFADSVSKSANYCVTSKKNNTGLLLLCEVALGNMHELKGADYITKLPSGKHSTKGIGRTQPDISEVGKSVTGATIPYGKGVNVKNMEDSALLYNEYIVYDVNQVQIQYLVRMKFKYN